MRNATWPARVAGVSAALLVLTACSSDPASNDADGSFEPIVWKYDEIVPEQDRLFQNFSRIFIEHIEEETDGDITFEVFPSRTLGFEAPQQMEAVSRGLSDVSVVTMSASIAFYPKGDVVDLPLLMPNDAELRKAVINDVVAPEWGEDLEAEGIATAAVIQVEPRALYTSDEVTSLTDIEGKLIRVIPGPEQTFTTELGGTPASLGGAEDVYLAMETGSIDGYWLAHGAVVGAGLDEVSPYSWDIASGGAAIGLLVNQEKLESLPEEYQEIVRDAGQLASDAWWDALPEIQEKGAQDLRDAGVTINYPSEADAQLLLEAAEETWAKTVSDAPDPGYGELLSKIQDSIATHSE